MPLINCEINLILTSSEDCVISPVKLCVTVVTLSTQDNEKLLQQLKLTFKRAINWDKYQPKVSPEKQNQYLGFLIDPNF